MSGEEKAAARYRAMFRHYPDALTPRQVREMLGIGQRTAYIPAGIFSSGGRTLQGPRQILYSGALCVFLLDRWADAPDMLTAAQAAFLCGYGASTINRWVRDGIVEAVNYRGTNLISKESLAERLASHEGQLIPIRSTIHEELLEEFQAEAEEQNSGMEWGSMPLSM